jgi:hypothetical protein
MNRQHHTGTANPDTGHPLASGNEVNATAPRNRPDEGPRAGARQAADNMRIADGGTSGEGPVVNPSSAEARDGGMANTAPAAGHYDTKH